MSSRLALPSRRNHITQKVRIPGRTLYISVHDDPSPVEMFIRVKGADCTPETIALYDVTIRLMSLTLQYGASLEKLGDLLTGAKFTPCGSVSGHDRLNPCSSLLNLIGRPLFVEYFARTIWLTSA